MHRHLWKGWSSRGQQEQEPEVGAGLCTLRGRSGAQSGCSRASDSGEGEQTRLKSGSLWYGAQISRADQWETCGGFKQGDGMIWFSSFIQGHKAGE